MSQLKSMLVAIYLVAWVAVVAWAVWPAPRDAALVLGLWLALWLAWRLLLGGLAALLRDLGVLLRGE